MFEEDIKLDIDDGMMLTFTNPRGVAKYLRNHRHSLNLLLIKHITILTETSHKVDFNRGTFLLVNSGSKPNSYDFVHLIRACTRLGGGYFYGQQLHCYTLRSGYHSDGFVSTALITFYVKFHLVNDAQKLFEEITDPNLVSWNSLISGYVQSGQFSKGLGLFLRLERSGLCSDSFSVTAALAACGHLSLLQLGKSIHSKIVKLGVHCGVVVANCLIDMYGKCGSVEHAIGAFNGMEYKDIISWNSVIAACARNRRLELAFNYFHSMPNPDTISYNELINGIAQFGNMEDAIEILSNMPNSNSSSWNSIVTGCVNRRCPRKALDFFSKMHSNGIEMDQFTFSSTLSGVASIAAFIWGIVIHCCTIKCGLDESVVVGSALIDMYSKCGHVKTAESLFESLPNKNLVTWNAMISGYAHNGNSTKVIELFEELKLVRGVNPDEITFINVLASCWHNKMPLEFANQYFESMINDYGIDPTAEHCSCIVRIMGQENEAWRAEKMIYKLGFGSCGMVWRALLGACATCGDMKVAEIAAAKLIVLEGDNECVYVMVSNVYAYHGKWEDVGEIRKLMREKRVRKGVGNSWIEAASSMF